LRVEFNANGSVRRFDCGSISLALFLGNALEGGPANLYLRRHAEIMEWTPLLGPVSRTHFHAENGQLIGVGEWRGIRYSVILALARETPTWFWQVRLENESATAQQLDLTYAQDLALAPYGAVRLNEYYVSQYLDHTPLAHALRGVMVASRQNLAADARHPWSLIGSLRTGCAFGTDALQFHGLASRAGHAPVAMTGDLPNRRLQHEHSMVVIRDAPLRLERGDGIAAGFFGTYVADHPSASGSADLDRVTEVLALAEAQAPGARRSRARAASEATLFSASAPLQALDLGPQALRALFEAPWRQEELDDDGSPLSFFHGADHHVVLRRKELRVLRPHGHVLRTGRHLTPDETALTSTAWMSGVFHSMLTQGHVSINRFLSTVHGYLGLYRSHGQRVFIHSAGTWRLLDVPSAFEMSPQGCRWIYRHDRGALEVRAEARSDPQELTLAIEVSSGEPVRFLISHHVALNGDDGSTPGSVRWSREGDAIVVKAAPEGDVGRRFPDGSFRIVPMSGTKLEQVGGDELLFLDGRSREQPYLCVITAPAAAVGLRIQGRLLAQAVPPPLSVAPGEPLIPPLTIAAEAASKLAPQAMRLADIAPWYTHNALVHYLSPRGLEQYSGGGWGTRDVCQGPVEMLLALGRFEPVRDLLLRVMANQNPDGDWPQWFMFFEREREIRAGDSHGDIVFWPLLVLAQYLTATGDATVLDEPAPFFGTGSADSGKPASLWEHVQRALALIESRVIPSTALAAYGHGDWNDSLQPADPAMRERLCSAWTVTLHFQAFSALAAALRSLGRNGEAVRLESGARAVLGDFQRLLVKDGVLAGYALFEAGGQMRYLLHPSDELTGVRYSALAMIHAILEDLFTPSQAREHLRLIDAHLTTPDGVRLFDRPMPYRGGPERLFQRAESATYFGREIGLMYTHAHLRYAQAMAHLGEPGRFFHALCQANPIGIRSLVPAASLRQANCYYSSSDATFADRYQASAEYGRVASGTIPLEGGWRVYSSGAGIALALIRRCLLGLSIEFQTLSVDPVIPAALDGLRTRSSLLGRPVEVVYRVGSGGCGVNALALNRETLAFTPGDNPHRRAGARVDKAVLLERLRAQGNTLTIEIG
jgi:cellobiose phosphorylase